MSVFQDLTNLEDSFDSQDLIMLAQEPSDERLEQLESIQMLYSALEGYSVEEQIKTLKALAAADSSVEALIGDNEDMYLYNFKQAYESAMEGFWQDWFRWGPFGALIGLYLQSFGRIRRCCKDAINDGISQDKMNNWTARSLYLPDAKEFFKALDGLQALYDAMVSAAKNIDKFEPSQLFDKLKGTGIACTEKEVNGVKKFDLKAVIGSWIGSIFFGAAGVIVGGHMGSDKGGKLGQRGWNAANMVEAAKRMIKMVDQGEELKSIKNNIVENSAQAKKEYGYKIEFLNKCGKVYLEDIKEIGRGLASAIYHEKK